MIKINNNLSVEHELSKFLINDPISCTLLMYFILDHPGGEDNGSSISIQELSSYLGYTPRIVKKRLEYLEAKGFIESFTPEFFGGKRLASIYMLNFDSDFFLKPA